MVTSTEIVLNKEEILSSTVVKLITTLSTTTVICTKIVLNKEKLASKIHAKIALNKILAAAEDDVDNAKL